MNKQEAEGIAGQIESALQHLHRLVVTLEPTRGTPFHARMHRALGLAIGDIDGILHDEIYRAFPEFDPVTSGP